VAGHALRPLSDAVRILVRLIPRGGADRIEGVGADGSLRARVRAPAIEGAANEALLRLVAEELNLPRAAVTLERGATARLKRLRLDGVTEADLLARWPSLTLSSR
jgi:uncharacterized protein